MVRLINPKELELGTTLGRGGYGTVSRAVWRNQPVAVKQLVKGIFTVDEGEEEVDPEVFKNFWTEVATMARLGHHENLVDLIGVSPNGAEQRLVLELCSHGSLWDVLFQRNNSRSSSLLPDQKSRLWIAKDVAVGMAHLHDCKVQHRDLKPENILLSRNSERVVGKIADFGLAKLRLQQNRKTTADVLKGSVTYVAPELLRQMVQEGMGNYTYTNAADVYSYGILLYELFTGEQHLAGMTDLQKSRTVLASDYRVKMPPLEPEGLRRLIQACVETEPERRPSFGTAAQVLEDIMQNRPTRQLSEPDLSASVSSLSMSSDVPPRKSHLTSGPPRNTSLTPSPSQQNLADPPAPTAEVQTPKPKKIYPKAKVLHSWQPGPEHKDNFMAIRQGDVLDILQRDENKGWTWGIASTGTAGWFPNSFVQMMQPKDQVMWLLQEGKPDDDILATMTKFNLSPEQVLGMVAKVERPKLLSTLATTENVNQLDEGKTPLHVVATALPSDGSLACAQILMEKGANPNQRDRQGQSPIVLAVRNVPVLKILCGGRLDAITIEEGMEAAMKVLNEDPRSDAIRVLQSVKSGTFK